MYLEHLQFLLLHNFLTLRRCLIIQSDFMRLAYNLLAAIFMSVSSVTESSCGFIHHRPKLIQNYPRSSEFEYDTIVSGSSFITLARLVALSSVPPAAVGRCWIGTIVSGLTNRIAARLNNGRSVQSRGFDSVHAIVFRKGPVGSFIHLFVHLSNRQTSEQSYDHSARFQNVFDSVWTGFHP